MIFRLLPILACCAALSAADFDLLFRNARVVDGSGNPWFRADVGVKNGRIAAIGALPAATATRTIDARERVLAPGFIDVHTHIEGAIERIPSAGNFVTDGVTTVVTGNCGSSEERLGDFLTRLEQRGVGINVASLVGHNTVRREVMGEANRPATADEIARMQALVERAMSEGAVGFSTGLIYIPGTYSTSDEVVALAKAAARHGGLYASHMRDEGERVFEAIDEALRVGREAHMPVEISHFKIDVKRLWGASDKTLARIDQARSEGIDVVIDQYPYDRSSTNLGVTLPAWALADGQQQVRQRLTDPATRARVLKEMVEQAKRQGHKDYAYAMVASCASDHSIEGKTITEINRQRGRKRGLKREAETILDLEADGGAQMVYHEMSEKDVTRILRYPNTAVASDGGVRAFGVGVPHPRAYGTNARVLSQYVREQQALPLEDAIRRMTSLPARTFGFRDRGLLREGYWADLVLFDPAAVRDKATFDKPHQYSEGFDLVLVNGQPVVEDGKITGARPGKALRHQQ
jgi:N-acyl-D-amino-acid deacylase